MVWSFQIFINFKSMKKALFVLVLVSAFIGRTQSEYTVAPYSKQISFRHLTVKDGLSQNSVVSMVQDSIGYLWFATQDGLNRYDGREFTHFDKQFQSVTRPTFSKLGKLYIDKQNRFWILNSAGNLQLYNYTENTFSSIKTNYEIGAVFQDLAYNFYVGTYGDGLYKIKANTQDTLQLIPSKVAPDIYDFLESNKNIYVATSKGVIQIKPDETYRRIASEIPQEIHVSSLIESNGTLWIGTFGGGLYYKSGHESKIKKFKNLGHQFFPEQLNIEDLLVDHSGKLWIATYGQGVYLLDFSNEKISHFKAQKNNPFAIHYKDVLCLLEDNAGNVWLGTDGAGASYYDEHLVKFNLLTNKQLPSGINVDVVRSITTDTSNNLWLGTSGLGLTKIDMASTNHYTFTSSNSDLKSNRVVSLNFNNGNLWIGHQDSGLNIMNSEGRFTWYLETSNFTIWNILPITSEKAWLATEKNGLILFDFKKGIEKEFNAENSNLKADNIRTIVYGDASTLWIGSSDDGLYKMDLKSEEITRVKEVSDDIKSLWWGQNELWIGTNGKGLKQLLWPSKEIRVYTQKDGLRNDVIYGVIPDDSNLVWVSTNLGISSLKLEEDESVLVENYTDANGLQGLEFNTGAYYKDKNGVIYFGGLEGVNWFTPDQITVNEVIPKTVITKIELFGEQIDAPSNTSFANYENTLTFNFSSLHFSQPNQNQFKYRLINNDEKWIDAGNLNTAHYTNLPANDYTFEVISSNYDGIWNNTPAQYFFTIKKPWYASTFAIILYILSFGFLIYAVYLYLKWRWKLNTQLQLEHAETKRLQKLDDFKTKLYTNISHEFRTPLTLISGPISHLLDKENIAEEDKNELSLVQHNANRLLYLVNQMMDLSMLDAGHLPLKVTQGSISILISQLVESFRYQAKKKHISLHADMVEADALWFDSDVVEKITSNLVSNGIKYTPEKGDIWLKTSLQKNHFVLTVINTYNYMSHNNLEKLFERFYQGENSVEGVGVGLALVKELVELSHGTIVASTLDDERIQFSVTLPITKDAFLDSEIISSEKFSEEKQKETSTEIDADSDVLLIVDDEPQIRRFITSLFKDQYLIIEAENGREGISKAIKNIPDLIISDIMMPKSDGIELCNTLKNDSRTSHIPIILLTAKVGAQPELEGLKTGADAYITKPFVVENLKTRVAKLIETRKQLQDYYSKELKIDPKLTISEPDAQFAKQLEEVLTEHITDPEFSAAIFCDTMFMSRMQLHRKLKALFGISTTEFIRNQRLKLATSLLLEGKFTIAEVGYAVGFNTPSYFMKCFKENYGCTPSDYMNKQQ